MSSLRKLCCMFDILPTSFILVPTFDNREATPFASGGTSDVYKATLRGRGVAVKVLRAHPGTAKSFRWVSGPHPPASKESLTLDHKLVEEVVGWKWIRHENILPFVGVSLGHPLFSIASERMENGNIMNFIKAHPSYNRLGLVSGGSAGFLLSH